MKRFFLFLTSLAALMLFHEQASAQNQRPSGDMILILIHHKSGSNFLSPKGLLEDKAMKAPLKVEIPEYELYRVPDPSEASFSVYLHPQSGLYWIRVIGGAAGSDTFYGPGQVKDLRK